MLVAPRCPEICGGITLAPLAHTDNGLVVLGSFCGPESVSQTWSPYFLLSPVDAEVLGSTCGSEGLPGLRKSIIL